MPMLQFQMRPRQEEHQHPRPWRQALHQQARLAQLPPLWFRLLESNLDLDIVSAMNSFPPRRVYRLLRINAFACYGLKPVLASLTDSCLMTLSLAFCDPSPAIFR